MKRTLCVFNRNSRILSWRFASLPPIRWLMRLRGLLGKLRLKPDDGIWLVPSRGIHTIGMLFAIDLVYLDAANRVIHLVEHLGPFRISPIRIKCASILELRSRAIYSSNTQIGDELLICAPEEIRAVLRAKSRLQPAVADRQDRGPSDDLRRNRQDESMAAQER